jgi:hypothetical protein
MYRNGLILNKSLIKAHIYQRKSETELYVSSVKKKELITM